MKLLVVLVAASLVGLTGCGDDEPTAATTDTTAAEGTGVVAVSIEEMSGRLIEGFEVGLRFETADGEVIDSTLWSDFVQSQGSASLDAYYESILEQDVPSGEVVVLASANVGPGGPPEVPDLDGELRCRLVVDVPDDGRVEVEVGFADQEDCLRLK